MYLPLDVHLFNKLAYLLVLIKIHDNQVHRELCGEPPYLLEVVEQVPYLGDEVPLGGHHHRHALVIAGHPVRGTQRVVTVTQPRTHVVVTCCLGFQPEVSLRVELELGDSGDVGIEGRDLGFQVL